MAEIDRARTQSLYGELKGYLDTLPAPVGFNGPNRIGRRFNAICDELTTIARTDFSHLKLNETEDDEDHNGYGFDGATLKSSIAGLVARLEVDYGFEEHRQNSQPAIVINNQNTNTIDININFTIETLIANAQSEEEKENLQAIDQELKKPNADWTKVKKPLAWVVDYSKDLSLKVIPLILDYYLKKGG